MTLNDIDKIVIIVEINGSAHQVLTSKENKIIALNMIASADNKLSLDREMMPIEFDYKEKVKK